MNLPTKILIGIVEVQLEMKKQEAIDEAHRLTIDADHIYRYAGRVLSGVTSIIGAVIPRKHNPGQWYLARGKALHHAIHLLAQGNLDFTSIDESYLGKVNAFQKAQRELKFAVKYSEMMLHSDKLKYAGTIDCVADINGEAVLIDYKSSYEASVQLQLAAYWMLLDENGIKPLPSIAIALELKDDGNYECHWLKIKDLHRNRQTFLSVLTVYNFMVKNKLTTNQKEQ